MAFDLEAHRGGRALFPENTRQSFAHALSMGVDTLELDVSVTQDDVLIVSHDRRLNPDLARMPTAPMSLRPARRSFTSRSRRCGNSMSARSVRAAPMPRNFPSSMWCQERRFRR